MPQRQQRNPQDKQPDNHQRPSAKLRLHASRAGFAANPSANTPVDEQRSQEDQRRRPRRKPNASRESQQQQKRPQQQKNEFAQQPEQPGRRSHGTRFAGRHCHNHRPTKPLDANHRRCHSDRKTVDARSAGDRQIPAQTQTQTPRGNGAEYPGCYNVILRAASWSAGSSSNRQGETGAQSHHHR